jgi:hypothetical protein
MTRLRKTLTTALHDTAIYDAYQVIEGQRAIRRWLAQGRPTPPPHAIKRRTLLAYKQLYDIRILVETGTFRGDMVYAMRRVFSRIVSIELDRELHARACRRFSKLKHVQVLLGNSAELLPAVLQSIHEPALFWLDGHYSGPGTARSQQDTPIISELSCVLGHNAQNHVIMIDDAREFAGCAGYPTIEKLTEITLDMRPAVSLSIADDIIRITPSIHSI